MAYSHHLNKLVRFAWRTSRNFLCVFPYFRQMLFPAQTLAMRFGSAEIEYGVEVFRDHWRRLRAAGFKDATSVLEVGPGRNLVTALLFWSALSWRPDRQKVEIFLWDVFANMEFSSTALSRAAKSLLEGSEQGLWNLNECSEYILPSLRQVADQLLTPEIRYVVCSPDLFFTEIASRFDLVYSHAAIEHIWHISDFWDTVIASTKTMGWHSHRVDLADHGRRHNNYIEMLSYSDLSYWLMQRFTPGATNRWRASEHLKYISGRGMTVLNAFDIKRDYLPMTNTQLASKFRHLSDDDLKTVSVDIIARKL